MSTTVQPLWLDQKWANEITEMNEICLVCLHKRRFRNSIFKVYLFDLNYCLLDSSSLNEIQQKVNPYPSSFSPWSFASNKTACITAWMTCNIFFIRCHNNFRQHRCIFGNILRCTYKKGHLRSDGVTWVMWHDSPKKLKAPFWPVTIESRCAISRTRSVQSDPSVF